MMHNNRLIEIITNYSLGIRCEDNILINCNLSTLECAKMLLTRIFILGAKGYIRLKQDEIDDQVLYEGSFEQVEFYFSKQYIPLKSYNKIVTFISETNMYSLKSEINKMNAYYSGHKQYIKELLDKTSDKYCQILYVFYPTYAYAQNSRVSYSEFCKLYEQATMINDDNYIQLYANLSEFNHRLINYLSDKHEIRIIGENTDLSINVEKQRWINGNGEINIPDGEVFTAPVDKSTQGYISIDLPVIYNGISFDHVSLEFNDGQVIKHSTKLKDHFSQIIAMDSGARKIGEIGFGTNFNNLKALDNTMLDEKLGGTFHIALGCPHPETCNTFTSQIHMDMINLTVDKKVYVDGNLFLHKGQYDLGDKV